MFPVESYYACALENTCPSSSPGVHPHRRVWLTSAFEPVVTPVLTLSDHGDCMTCIPVHSCALRYRGGKSPECTDDLFVTEDETYLAAWIIGLIISQSPAAAL